MARRVLWLLSPVLVACCAGCQGDPAQAKKPNIPEANELSRLAVGVHEQTASLPDGGTLRYTISIPQNYEPSSKVPLVVALHYGGDVTPFYGRGMINGLLKPALHDLGAMAIAPDSLGGDWRNPRNEQAVIWLTRSVMKSYAIDTRKVVVTGFSMGGQGAWYLGGRHQDLFTAVVPVAGEPAGGSLDWQIPVYVIHSQIDEIIPIGPTKRQVEQLKSKGVKIKLQALSNLTHYQTKQYAIPLGHAVAWLKQEWK
jgi:predicted peptidase